MKKTIPTKPALKLSREHIRLLTPTNLSQVLGGYPTQGTTDPPTQSADCPTRSVRVADTCE